ncbi:YndJ family protein [Sphaerisporangium sp. NPDC049002]|uniref:YndJ family protein n=1 Tax=unclassified Sphaerisporangium TaxID=2630420 RepID=UPI003405628F
MTPLVNVIVMIGMLVVVPAGLTLIDTPRAVRHVWVAGAVPGALSLWLARGTAATALAVVYALATAVPAGHAAVRAWRHRSLAPREVAVLTALSAPAVAGLALVWERAGHALLGFKPAILALTVAHFHFAGFAAALVAGLVCRATGDRAMARAAALAVPCGTALVFLGYFVDDWAELAGAVVLTAGMWLVGWLTWTQVRRGAADRLTRVLLGACALTLSATMLLALSWAVGEATGLPHPSVEWMAATHGVCNAAGFALCGLAAWRRLRTRPL